MEVTVVIPTYNGADWLPKSVPKVDKALQAANLKNAEILIIDDGSTDLTLDVVKKIKTKYPLRVVSQQNGGRFLARKTGALEAKYLHLLFVDTRVFIGETSLAYVLDHYDEKNNKVIWNSHVNIDKEGNIYARFWDAIAFVAWRKYFINPRDISYGIEEFDYYPKGTTCFFVPKNIMIEANEWFEKHTNNEKAANDDTLLIRHMAEVNQINISPKFWCLYHARSNLSQFTKHVKHRGQVFVDGFLRRDGNRFFRPLIGFLVLSVAVPVVLILEPSLISPAIILGVALWILELIVLLLLSTPKKDAVSLFILSPLFGVYYGFGIWKATIVITKNRILR